MTPDLMQGSLEAPVSGRDCCLIAMNVLATVNPLLSPPGGSFFSSTFERGHI